MARESMHFGSQNPRLDECGCRCVSFCMENPPASAIRALFFDLDGTLLTSKKEISPGTLDALRHCAGKGIGIFAATARPPNLERQLGLARDQAAMLQDGVFLNGAFLKLDGKTEWRCIGKEQTRRII